MVWGLKEFQTTPLSPRIGLTFMAGADAPQVNRIEQGGMTQSLPDQKTTTWRVNTTGALLRSFDVDKDLSIIQADNTSVVISKARDRRVFRRQCLLLFRQPLIKGLGQSAPRRPDGHHR